MKIKKGDKVKVISGKDRGKIGEVKDVFKKVDKVVVNGVNIITKHQKPTGDESKPSGILKYEGPIHVSNVMLIDPKNNKPTRIGYKIKDGKKVRFAKKSNTILK